MKKEIEENWEEELLEILIGCGKCFHFDDMPAEMRVEHHFSYCLEGLECDLKVFISQLLKSEKERLLERVEEIVKDETKYETQSSLENIFIKINRIKESLKKEL